MRYSKRDEPGNLESFREFSVPSGFLEDSLQHDAMEVVGNISCPILFLAGDLDTGVTPDDVRRMFNVAKDPKKFVVIEGAGHDYRRSTDLIEQVNGCTIDFLTINNLV